MTIKVLLIDDQEVNIDLLRNLLKKFFSSIEIIGISTDPLEALSLAHTLQPDLLFLDIQMPAITGLDVVATIGAARMPATIFVTAYEQFAVRAFEANAVDYLVKPFSRERFAETLRRAKQRALYRRSGGLQFPCHGVSLTKPVL